MSPLRPGEPRVTVLMSVMAGFGIILSAQVNRARRMEQTRALL